MTPSGHYNSAPTTYATLSCGKFSTRDYPKRNDFGGAVVCLETKIYEFGKFRLDPKNQLLLSNVGPISLAPKAFNVLLVLVQNGSRLTTKDELMTKVWPNCFVEEANLTINISVLRKALRESSDGQQYIETVPKRGYRFAVPVKTLSDLAPLEGVEWKSDGLVAEDVGPVTASADEPEKTAPNRRISARLIFALVSALLFLIISARYLFFRGAHASNFSPGQTHRVAVLPFQNLRANPESDFLGFSLADAVITKLSYVSGLSVRPSFEVQKYKVQPQDIRKVARDLNVDALLTGTFLREGDDLRIGCQLIDANAQSILWKGAFDLKYDKLLMVQDWVAEQIIKGLELTLSPSDVAHLRADAVVSPQAYEYYLRGVDLYSSGDFSMAIKMLERSVALAPSYSLGWAYLGKSYTANASFELAGAEQYEKAEMAFERALALEPDQIDARIYMANLFTDTGRVEKAVPLLRQALGIDPGRAEVHWELGYAYRFASMLEESALECENARRMDPAVKLNSSTLNAYLYQGQYERFLDSLPRSDDVPLITFYRAFGEYHRKNWEAARADFDRAYELDRVLLQAQVGKALSFAIRHQGSQGLAILRDLESKVVQRGVGDPEATYKIAQAYVVLGDTASAMRVLKRSIDRGFFPYPYFVTDPLLNPLRTKPEFPALMQAARQRHLAFAKQFF